MKYCKKCGSPIKEDSRFCESCGENLQAPRGMRQTKKALPIKKILPIILLLLSLCMLGGAASYVIFQINENKDAGLYDGLDEARMADRKESGEGKHRHDAVEEECEICEEIEELQEEQLEAELKKRAPMNEARITEGADFSIKEWGAVNSRIASLRNEIQALGDHECNQTVEQVEDCQYAYGNYNGNYSGGWKSVTPYGEGTFVGAYEAGGERFILTYTGEWSNGKPGGNGFLMTHRRSLVMDDIWHTEMYEGTFVNGRLTGEGWSSFESERSGRTEYLEGTYNDGFLEGQAYYAQYIDGELYDMGIVEGNMNTVIFSERQALIEAAQDIGVAIGAAATLYAIREGWKIGAAEAKVETSQYLAGCVRIMII